MIIKTKYIWERISVASLLVFMSLGPVYWFGAVPIELIQYFCLMFLFFFCGFSTFSLVQHKKSIIKTNAFTYSEFVLLFIFMFISAVINSDINSFTNRMFDLIFIFILIKIILQDSYIFHLIRVNIWKSGWMIVILSIIILSSFLLNIPNWNTPFGVDGRYPPLSFVGFAGSRTGWSLGVLFLMPLFFISGYRFFRCRKILLIISVILYIVAVAIPAGRTGIIMSFLNSVLIFYIYFKGSLIKFFIGVITIFSIGLFLIFNAELFRLSSLFSGSGDISSGRMEGNYLAISLILESPFWGHGSIDLTEYGLAYGSIHNFWLKMGAEYGLFVILILASMFLKFFLFIYKIRGKMDTVDVGLFICILNGLVFTLVEPGAILGQLKLQVVFWVSIALLLGRKRHLNHQFIK
jgi:hypothetical protein